VPVRVLRVDGLAAEVVDRLGQRTQVAVDFVPGVRPGDVLLVHTGVAIGRVEANP
jgi:hydrogenase expression/formation protein HypC